MILTIRAHKRYAVRQSICLRSTLDDWLSCGLMIELSSEGCRISGLGSITIAPGDAVVVEHEDMQLHGRICWVHSNIAGVRLDTPLTTKELTARLISLRGEEPHSPAMELNEAATRRRA